MTGLALQQVTARLATSIVENPDLLTLGSSPAIHALSLATRIVARAVQAIGPRGGA